MKTSSREVCNLGARAEAKLATDIKKESEETKDKIMVVATKLEWLAAHIDKLEDGGTSAEEDTMAKGKSGEKQGGRVSRHIMVVGWPPNKPRPTIEREPSNG